MVISPKSNLAFVHIPKTAGITVTTALGGMASEYRTHAPASELTEEHRELTSFAVVRNPMDWYVSNYLFKTQGANGKYDNVGSFEDFVEDMTVVSERTTRWFQPWPRVDPQRIIEPILKAGRTDIGLFTANYLYYCFEGYEDIIQNVNRLSHQTLHRYPRIVSQVLRTETLADDFARMVRTRQLNVDPDTVARGGRQNQSRHGHFSEYYSQEMRNEVLRKDRLVFGRYYPLDAVTLAETLIPMV